MENLTELKNIGTKLMEQLKQVGINSYSELKKIGAKNAWLKILEIDSSACIHRLLALEGAIRNVKKSELDANVKQELKNFYNAVKGK